MLPIDIHKLLFVEQSTPKFHFRHYLHYILQDNKQKYILAVAKNACSKRRLMDAVTNQEALEAVMGTCFAFNPILQHGELSEGNRYHGLYYVLYPYLENAEHVCKYDFSPIERYKQYYAKSAQHHVMSELIAERIIDDLLRFYCPEFRPEAKSSPLIQELRSYLLGLKEIDICAEHADGACVNMLRYRQQCYLVDFEFSRLFQPTGHDMYFYYRHHSMLDKHKNDIPHFEYHHLKARLLAKLDREGEAHESSNSKVEILPEGLIAVQEDSNSLQIPFAVQADKILITNNPEKSPTPYAFLLAFNLLRAKFKGKQIAIKNATDCFAGLNPIDRDKLLFEGTLEFKKKRTLQTMMAQWRALLIRDNRTRREWRGYQSNKRKPKCLSSSASYISPMAHIGDHCTIAAGASIGVPAKEACCELGTYPFFNSQLAHVGDLYPSITLGHDVTIGANATVLAHGGIIGTGAIIKDKAYVIDDVPPYAIVEGNPATIVGYRFDDQKIRQLLREQNEGESKLNLH